MKTSNKLLIAFAAALIIVPILSMVYASKAYYIDSQTWADLEKQNDSFDGKSENMEAIQLNQFNAISIADGKEYTFYIRLIKDNKFGIKIYKEHKDLVKCSVDKDGKLQITLTGKNVERRYINLLIYAPTTNALNVNNASTIELNAKGDSIVVNLKKFEDFRFGRDAKFQKASINAEDGYTIFEGNTAAKSIYLNLKNANFRSAGVSFEDLDIASAGKSDIDVFGGKANKEKYAIRNLALKTTDSANVTFRSIDIGKAKGSLSDQTIIQIPVANLKQILK
ncbi:GIN domain-containing protein [Pedobacter xixiisoli]|uniref:Putative auto-transporter adhesin head GIN domain-containing protein n=1 Tax=Pedobacter xixiisoli TaxID=1476464 RepID=A0A286ACM9_9SPHI|nr:DUF2807 domain-containing protein [Pedobacter xixiisoli]SOD19662.1 hypothetical protein SAMN06297358_3367 [Pedobacter xixiisoli]